MMYHRILPPTDPRYALEEPGMIVEPKTFKMHLQVLKREFTIISLEEWVDRLKSQSPLPEKSCAITFDDGWLDNYEFALPILKQEQVPATLFAVSNMIGTNSSFWPNRLITLLNQPYLRIKQIDWLFKLINNKSVTRELSAQAIYSLKYYPDDQLMDMITEAEQILGIAEPIERSLMNWDELQTWANEELLSVGSHTCHHFRLRDDLSPSIMQEEIENSRLYLQQKLGQPIEIFCYPNGDTSQQSITLVSKQYKAAVTTQKGINETNSIDLYRMNRIGVHQHNSETPTKLLSQLACWP
jgi:peptidoglycan/xylan/chitin deacetylase (PgdA/CDA1 family)